METYEKKYKEAKDKIAARFGINVAKEIFTDLYESEDERIRKAIIELLNTTIKGKKVYSIADTTRSEMIAWLENIPITIDHAKREGFHLGYKAGLEKQGTSYTKRDVDNTFVEGMAFAKDELEKQGEQKPILDFNADDWYVSEVDGKIHNTYHSVDKIEPKQEWSEEDEVRLQACLDTLQAKSLFGVVDTVMTEWLKSLKERLKGE